MRKSILLSVLAVACAGDPPGSGHRVIRDFEAVATRVACELIDLGQEAPDEVRGVSDTSFLVLNAAERRITEYGDGLEPLWTLEYDAVGPAAIDRPASATLLGDRGAVVVARGGLRLVVVDRAGELIEAAPLGFIPASVAATAAGDILITALPLGGAPGTVLARFRDGELEELPVPKRSYIDMTINALGNAALVEVLPGDTAVVVHQYFAPRAFRVAPAPGAAVWPLAVPVPDATAGLVDAVPRAPLTQDQSPEFLVPAVAMSVDRGRREIYLLTRTGRYEGGRSERAVIRTDDRLGFLAAYILDVHARHIAVLPRRRVAVVADDLDNFYLCPLHDADTHTD